MHLGHRKIISRMNEIARKIEGESVLLTFDPHPRMVLYPEDHGLQLLTTLDEKVALLKESGIDNLIVHPFTREFSRTTSIDFVRNILVNQLGTNRLVIGYDHHFGRNREGSFEHLKEFGPLYGFEVEEIPAEELEDVSISSTKIRQALDQGDVATANSCLGSVYRISGFVIEGNKLGRQLGFPTANIRIDHTNKLIPANGVYAVLTAVNGQFFKGMLNIGHRPTVNALQTRTIEVHIFDFEGDLYGKTIELHFKERIRDEQKFEGLQALQQQLELDKLQSLHLL